MEACLSCGSPNLFLLGTLGNIIWYRCQNCGIDLRTTDKNTEIEGED